MKFFNGILKDFGEYSKFGMVKIIEEMFYFGFGVEELKMPSICDANSTRFLKKFTKWKLEASRMQGGSKVSMRMSDKFVNRGKKAEMIQTAANLLMKNVCIKKFFF